MQGLNQDIKKNEFSHIYLLYGEEDYLRKQYRDKLKKALGYEENSMNFHIYQGKDANPLAIIDMAETMPFLADKRVFLIEDTGWLKTSGDAFADYIKNVPDYAYFIIVEKEIDKRNKLFKAIRDNGHVTEFAVQDINTLIQWIGSKSKQEKKQFEPKLIAYFLSRVGNDMENIQKELEKLFCFTYSKNSISQEDIDAICTRQLENKIFEMIEHVARKQQKEALDLYYDLLNLKEAPLKILALLARHFNILLQIKLLSAKGYDQNTIASKLNIKPYFIGKYVQQMKGFKIEELKEAVANCLEYDELVKTGRMIDTISVEIILVKFSKS